MDKGVGIGEVIALSKVFGGGGGSSGGGVLVVNISEKKDSKSGDTKGPVTTPYVCDKTAGEMWSALTNGNGLLFHIENATYSEFDTLKYAGIEDGVYGFAVATGGASMTFISDSVDAYPETT
jgi:hypothetical protein